MEKPPASHMESHLQVYLVLSCPNHVSRGISRGGEEAFRQTAQSLGPATPRL